ncbi:hypothetical protein KJ855_02045 [Patescibacteria group bacterium]|nr:hypothetical protein [Patescibacteria group bacterium]
MNYGQIVDKAIIITKKYKYLWWLSLLTIIGGVAQEGGGSSFNFNFSQINNNFSNHDFNQLLNQFPAGKFVQQVFHDFWLYFPVILGIILILLIIRIIFYIIGLIAKGGLIAGIDLADQNKKSSLSKDFGNGKKLAWNLFLTRLIGGLVTLGIVIIGAIVMIVLFFLFFLTIPAFIVILIIIPTIFHIAQILVVIKKLSPTQAIGKSWEIFKKHWTKVALLWLINLGISLLIIFAIGILILVLGIIFGIILAIISIFTKFSWIILAVLLIPLTIIIIIIIFAIGMITNTFFTSFWTLGTKELIKLKI